MSGTERVSLLSRVYRSPVEWRVGPVGLGPSDSVAALGLGWMAGQGFAVWLWRWVFTVGAWPGAETAPANR